MLATLALPLLLGISLPVEAEPTLFPGDRIRYARPGERLMAAHVLAAHGGWLLVQPADGRGPVRVRLMEPLRLEVWRGRRSHARAGAIIGFVPGALVGLKVGALACLDSPRCPLDPYVRYGLVAGGATAVIGAAIGSAIKTDRWERVKTGGATASFTPLVTRGVGVGLTVSWR